MSAGARARRARPRHAPARIRWSARVVVDDEGVVVGAARTSSPAVRTPRSSRSRRPGQRARGATLYCTLEPCSHTGRTGPCAPRSRRRESARVVAGDGGSESAGQRPRHRHSARARRRGRPSACSEPRPGALNAPFLTRDDAGPAVRHDEGGAQRRRPRGAGRRCATRLTGAVADRLHPPRSRRGRCDRCRIRHACSRTIRC